MASSSKYRKELLTRLGIPFECFSPEIDEDSYKMSINDPIKLAVTLSEVKAKAAFEKFPEYTIIGSDQLAHLDGLILGKAHTFENAAKQLSILSGQAHQLVTAVTIISQENKQTFVDTTTLRMKKLNSSQINFYLTRDNPVDCAGSYKLEQYGISLFDAIESLDHTAIIGLPLIKTGQVLESFGFSIPPTA